MEVSSIKDAINAPELPLSTIKYVSRCKSDETGLMGVRAVVIIAINEVVNFFNVGKTMNNTQAAITADLIIQNFYWLKLEDLKLCFRRQMAFSKVYDRLDGNVIMGWIKEYDDERTDIVTQISIDEAKDNEKKVVSEGMTRDQYEAYLKDLNNRSSKGDEEAINELCKLEKAKKKLIEDEKKRIKNLKNRTNV